MNDDQKKRHDFEIFRDNHLLSQDLKIQDLVFKLASKQQFDHVLAQLLFKNYERNPTRETGTKLSSNLAFHEFALDAM